MLDIVASFIDWLNFTSRGPRLNGLMLPHAYIFNIGHGSVCLLRRGVQLSTTLPCTNNQLCMHQINFAFSMTTVRYTHKYGH